MLSILNFFFYYSPLEQFDDLAWVVSTTLYESINLYNFYIFELEYSSDILFNTAALNGGFFLGVIVLILVAIYLTKIEFSHFFFLGLIHFFTGSIFFIWFNDYLLLTDNNSESFGTMFSQINMAILFDENIISFLAAFFLLGGAEEEEDEDFLLEEEEGDFVEDVVASLFISNLGKDVEDNGALFLKVCGIFGFVLTNNLMGMLPYSDTGTSSLILTFWVALSVFVSLLTLMIRKHGISYFFSLFMPSGCPLPLIFVLIPIEFISYSFRLVSLSVRLFANMMAGHTLLKVIVGFSWSMILMGDFFLIANLFPMAILFVLTFLELGVALIQAYIFTILTCIYLKDIFVAH